MSKKIALPEHYPEKLGLKLVGIGIIENQKKLPEHYPEKLGLKLDFMFCVRTK